MDFGNKINELHQIKFDLFKAQNPETGFFDVSFEIHGKLLYAHKTMLNLVSPTFASMLSDRWSTNKDEPIKIKDYTYNDFYQFLTFLYSAQCELTDSNIYAIVDIAEFYGVNLFKEYCGEYLATMKITTDNIIKLMELAEKYSMVQLKTATHEHIANNFQSFSEYDGFLKVDKSFIYELVLGFKDKIKSEDAFKAVYKWCEKQATDKQSADSNLNLNDAIKAEISDFLPYINFSSMEMKFMVQFLVPRGFIFSSLDELGKVMNSRFTEPRVKVTNSRGQTLHGNVISDQSVIDNIKALQVSTCSHGVNSYCWWNTKFTIPLTPSPLKKRNGVEWYLIYLSSGLIAIFNQPHVGERCFLLAELTAGTS